MKRLTLSTIFKVVGLDTRPDERVDLLMAAADVVQWRVLKRMLQECSEKQREDIMQRMKEEGEEEALDLLISLVGDGASAIVDEEVERYKAEFAALDDIDELTA